MKQEKKTARLDLKIEPSLKRRINAAARLDQRALSDWIRLALQRATEKQR